MAKVSELYTIPRKMAYEDIGINPVAHHINIFIDGERCIDCTAFNIDEGWLTRYKRNEDGKFVIDPTGEFAERETVKGNIEVKWMEGH